MRRIQPVLALFLLASTAHAQRHDMMPIVVQPDRILIGTQFVPRCLTLPTVLAVPVGQSVEAAADSTFDCIEVAGTLRVSRTHDTVLRFTHLFVLPGGTFDVGTQADPIPAGTHVALVVRNVPLDLSHDPFQWGNGLLNFGHQSRVGAAKLAWTALAADAHAGETTLTLAATPNGWRSGDELLLPDTQLAYPSSMVPRRESPITVASLAGPVVTLSKPLDFDHLAQTDPGGTSVLQPRVANVTRNVVVRTDGLPSGAIGTPGHTADVGHAASWDIEYNEFHDLGRTRAEVIDDTSTDLAHIGTNAKGRYVDHKHHAFGFGSSSIGNVLHGRAPSPIGKWGLVLHGTHDALVDSNIGVDFFGAAFVTEDGYEVRNTFRRNVGAYNRGEAGGTFAKDHMLANNPGVEGAGFWFHSTQSTLIENEAWNNQTGMNLFPLGQAPGSFPSTPGGALDTPMTEPDLEKTVPVLMRDNVMASNTFVGLEYWNVHKFPNLRQVAVYNYINIDIPISDNSPYFVDFTVIGKDGYGFGLVSSEPYIGDITFEGGRIAGCEIGMYRGGGQTFLMTGTTLQNAFNLDFETLPTTSIVLTDVLHLPLPGFPKKYMVVGDGQVWNGVDHFADFTNAYSWRIQKPPHFLIRNWQRHPGEHYRFGELQQLRSTMAWPAKSSLQWACPDAGITMGACFDKYGLAWNGEAFPDADVVELEGVVHGPAVRRDTIVLPPPRFVFTLPNAREGVPVTTDANGSSFRGYGITTGDPTNATTAFAYMSIDGGPATKVFFAGPFGIFDSQEFLLSVGTAEGIHTVRTWRADLAGQRIAASALDFTYVLGAAPPPPPPPSPPTPPPVTPAWSPCTRNLI
jgi:hypothetical protein